MTEQEQIESSTQKQALHDFAWGVTGANWFLIGIGALIQDSIRSDGFAGGASQFAGRLVAIAIAAAVPVAVIYLATSDKKTFRLRRAFTISAWCMLGLQFYPILSDFFRD